MAELKSDLAADDFYLHEFFATEAAFLSILMLFNLLAEFQRAIRMPHYWQPATLRVEVFLCGAILGRAGHRTVLHLSSAWGGLQHRNPLFDHLLAYFVPTSPKLNFETGNMKGDWPCRIPLLTQISDFNFGIRVETVGSGVALFDYNRDGLLGVFLVNGSSFAILDNPRLPRASSRLFRNNGDGTFTDVTEAIRHNARPSTLDPGLRRLFGEVKSRVFLQLPISTNAGISGSKEGRNPISVYLRIAFEGGFSYASGP
jgi:hypothetical protein